MMEHALVEEGPELRKKLEKQVTFAFIANNDSSSTCSTQATSSGQPKEEAMVRKRNKATARLGKTITQLHKRTVAPAGFTLVTPATDDNAESSDDDWGLSWACKDLEDLLARKEASTGPSLERLGMRTPRVVNVRMMVSGQTVVWVWQRLEHEWGTFVAALHYYASRKCSVPVWCVRLRWSYDPWNEALLPMSVTIQCDIKQGFYIDNCTVVDEDRRCCNCWEDCGDTQVLERWLRLLERLPPWQSRMRRYRGPHEVNCDECTPAFLCDLCNVQLPSGGSSCLQCLDADECAQLTQAQQNRWKCVRK